MALTQAGRLNATTDFSIVRELDTINICVPTPLRKTKDPDMSYIVSAVEAIAKHLHEGMLIVLESTTYPGTTDEVVQPLLEIGALHGVDRDGALGAIGRFGDIVNLAKRVILHVAPTDAIGSSVCERSRNRRYRGYEKLWPYRVS